MLSLAIGSFLFLKAWREWISGEAPRAKARGF